MFLDRLTPGRITLLAEISDQVPDKIGVDDRGSQPASADYRGFPVQLRTNPQDGWLAMRQLD